MRQCDLVEEILRLLPHGGVRDAIEGFLKSEAPIPDEIRLRTDRPLSCVRGIKCTFIDHSGAETDEASSAYIIPRIELGSVFRAVCENSVYAYIDDIRCGYITVRGGHRIGFCGRAVRGNDGSIENFRDINALSIRIAREVTGCADNITDSILAGGRVMSALIISPPGRGKTTLLRDLTRQISDRGIKVGLADDRSEISAMYRGVPQCDIGTCTDVVENARKTDAIEILQRTMSPSVIVTDEVVTEDEAYALQRASGTGIAIIASVHGDGFNEVISKPSLRPLFSEHVFDLLVLIKSRDETGLRLKTKILARGECDDSGD